MSTLAAFLTFAFLAGILLAFIAYVVLAHRRRATEAREVADLLESKRFYLALVENSLDTLGVFTPDGRPKFLNAAFEESLGYDRANLQNLDLRELIHPDDMEQFMRSWQELLRGKDPLEFAPFRYRAAEGGWHYKHLKARNMLDDPQIQGLVVATRNITDYMETLNELRLTEQRIRVALAGAEICIFNLDLEGRLIWIFNPLFNYTAEGSLGKTEAEVLPPQPAAQLAALRQKVLAEGGQGRDELDYVEDGERRVLIISYERMKDQYGNVIGIAGAATNITAQKTAVERLQGAQRMEAIGKLTGGVAHDFNNLLAIIVGNLELLQDHLADKPHLRHFVDVALKAADRGGTLTRSLLAFARKQTLSISIIDPNKLIDEIAELLRRSLPPSIRLNIQTEPGIWPCNADPGQLQNAIINLVINSRDAMPSGGIITISTANTKLCHDETGMLPDDVAAGDYVMIAVADNGTGMPPHILEHVFEPFFTTKAPGAGTGLGLSIVYGFAKQLGGHVAIQSAEGQGTTVRLYLPRLVEQQEQAETETKRRPSAASGETILVVDDDADVRQLTSSLLQLSGYMVVEAENGYKAMDIIESDQPISLMLTDVLLGVGPNGPELMELARTVRPRLPVVLMSGYTDMSMIENSTSGPAAPLLHKPFRRQELDTMIYDTLRAARNSNAPERPPNG